MELHLDHHGRGRSGRQRQTMAVGQAEISGEELLLVGEVTRGPATNIASDTSFRLGGVL